MKRPSEPFQFKQFTVSHSRSSMKVGVDGVLIGAWGAVDGAYGIDVGCGCGLIALMAAQRNSNAYIDAIDIDTPSVEEATCNFFNSPWSGRLSAKMADAIEFSKRPDNLEKYDFIVSNPPFFASGISDPSTQREKARHQGSLSPFTLISAAERLLRPGGTLSMIVPFDQILPASSLEIERECHVADREGKAPKRKMIIMRKGPVKRPILETLYVKGDSEALTSEFYL